MLRFHQEGDHSGGMVLGLVVGHRRATTLLGGNDSQSSMRKRGNLSRSASQRHRSGSMQDHESGRIVAYGQRAVSGQNRQRDQGYYFTNFRGTFEGDSG